MRFGSLVKISLFGISTILFKKKKPFIGSIILTDMCNLSCEHCRVNNVNRIIYSYSQIILEMQMLYSKGVRILLLYGGEPFLWKDGSKNLRNIVCEAKQMGFLYVSVVTNGTFELNLPEADIILVSLDGDKGVHNIIRGNTYELILDNIRQSPSNNICLYMAINKINKSKIKDVCEIASSLENVKAVSFNFHMPYAGTEHLKLDRQERHHCCNRISDLIDFGYPIMNLKSALPYIDTNSFATPCYQCVIIENQKEWICGRCVDIDGMCKECGYFFAAEYSLIFGGNFKVIYETLKTYRMYL